MDDKTKNTLIKMLMTNDKKDIWINETPIYGELRHNGNLIARYVKEYKYAVGVKHEANTVPMDCVCEKFIKEILINESE